jgi:hypothetical protein
MSGQSVFAATPRRRMLRLVVLALTLVGFTALHAFGSVAGDGTHCGSAPALTIVADPYGTAESSSADHHATTSTAQHDIVRADATTVGHNSDDVTTGCLLALFGALVMIGLRLLRRFGIDTTSPRVRHASTWLHAARAPPGPLFLHLCVLRL